MDPEEPSAIFRHLGHEGQSIECPACVERQQRYAAIVLPVVCERCGLWKRAPDGRALYVTLAWKKGKRMVCPKCQEAETTLEKMGEVVGVWEDDEEVPF